MLTDSATPEAIRTCHISRPVLSGSVCIGKASDDQVIMWMVTRVKAVLFFSSRFSVNDSFWAPANWGVALLPLTKLAGEWVARMHLIGNLRRFAKAEVQ